ncbi:hypothetical protein OPT61_g7322 [Boeremia exigua]|uniref:Uncharacterized protein n=1 Tax=Boeremia exigua TaxID=749465 RepID=A0ACC2I2N3_9PLEO|nr:hypothetical protein OPT61_g7322 [Boeremia exigua]
MKKLRYRYNINRTLKVLFVPELIKKIDQEIADGNHAIDTYATDLRDLTPENEYSDTETFYRTQPTVETSGNDYENITNIEIARIQTYSSNRQVIDVALILQETKTKANGESSQKFVPGSGDTAVCMRARNSSKKIRLCPTAAAAQARPALYRLINITRAAPDVGTAPVGQDMTGMAALREIRLSQ